LAKKAEIKTISNNSIEKTLNVFKEKENPLPQDDGPPMKSFENGNPSPNADDKNKGLGNLVSDADQSGFDFHSEGTYREARDCGCSKKE